MTKQKACALVALVLAVVAMLGLVTFPVLAVAVIFLALIYLI